MPESAFKTALGTSHSHTEIHELLVVKEGNGTGKKDAASTFSTISMLKCYLVLDVSFFSKNVRYISNVHSWQDPHLCSTSTMILATRTSRSS